MVFKW